MIDKSLQLETLHTAFHLLDRQNGGTRHIRILRLQSEVSYTKVVCDGGNPKILGLAWLLHFCR